jgi:hypothetical protein
VHDLMWNYVLKFYEVAEERNSLWLNFNSRFGNEASHPSSFHDFGRKKKEKACLLVLFCLNEQKAIMTH